MFLQYILFDLNCTKGQLISEQIYAVLNFPKMQRNIAMISALASKMGQIKKVKHIIILISDYLWFGIEDCFYFCDLTHFRG